jgi:dihydroorotate dehydrogenase (NAD+) catalytic subunit
VSVRIGPLELRNPVMTASGTCGYGLELEPYLDLSRLGALVLKGLSAEPRQGNPPPRIVETPSGLLNSIGLENIGVRRFVADVLPELRRRDVPLVGNVYATSAADFVAVAGALEAAGGIAALELNLSCPNVAAGGMSFGQDPCLASALVAAVRREVSLPIIVKLTPKVADITVPSRACEEAGADALTVANTWPGMAVDLDRRAPLLGNAVGGLSGPAIRPLTLRLVWEASRAVGIPVIGCGGIATWRDAAEYLVAGATAIQVGTAVLVDPACVTSIADGLADFLARPA